MVCPGEAAERLDIFSLMDKEFESLDTVLTGCADASSWLKSLPLLFMVINSVITLIDTILEIIFIIMKFVGKNISIATRRLPTIESM